MDLGLPVQYARLSADHEGAALDAYLVEIPAGTGHPEANRQGEGVWYVLSGRLEMTVGAESFVLGPGDSAHFDQRHPHTARATEDGPVPPAVGRHAARPLKRAMRFRVASRR